MDEHRFDDLTRVLASGHSRRRVLKLLGSGLVAGMLGARRAPAAEAQVCAPLLGACADVDDCCGDFRQVACQGTCCLTNGAGCVLEGPNACCPGSVCSPSGCCPGIGSPCLSNGNCCGFLICSGRVCSRADCVGEGSVCAADADCCGELSCRGGACLPPCVGAGDSCFTASDCCDGLVCNSAGTCAASLCAGNGESCGFEATCCEGLHCVGIDDATCRPCAAIGAACGGDGDCCDIGLGFACRDGICQAFTCQPEGAACAASDACCTDPAMVCAGGVCSADCALFAESCAARPCCGDAPCADNAGSGVICFLPTQCGGEFSRCAADENCCGSLVCNPQGICVSAICAGAGAACGTTGSLCCAGFLCVGVPGACVACSATGGACGGDPDCCTGLQCVAGACAGPTSSPSPSPSPNPAPNPSTPPQPGPGQLGGGAAAPVGGGTTAPRGGGGGGSATALPSTGAGGGSGGRNSPEMIGALGAGAAALWLAARKLRQNESASEPTTPNGQ